MLSRPIAGGASCRRGTQNQVDTVSQLHSSFVSGVPAPKIEGKFGDLVRRINHIQRAPRVTRDEILGVAQEFSNLQRPVNAAVVLALYLRDGSAAASAPELRVPVDRMANTQAVVAKALERNGQALKAGIVDGDTDIASVSPSAVGSPEKHASQAFTPTRAYRSVDKADVPSPDSHERFQSRMEIFDRGLEKAKRDSAQDCTTRIECFEARVKVAYNTLGVGFNALGVSFTGKEGGTELGKFAACNTPPISVGCAAKDFYASPTLLAGVMVPLSAIPGVRAVKDILKVATVGKVAKAANAQGLLRAAEDERKIAEFASSRGVSASQVAESKQLADIIRTHFPDSNMFKNRYMTAYSESPGIADQGIKLHIGDPGYGARKELLQKIIESTRKPELAGRVNFKIDVMSETLEGSQQGKFITVYTRDPKSAKEIATALDQSLADIKLSGTATNPPDNLPFGTSGLISWRYGPSGSMKLRGKDPRNGETIDGYDDHVDPRANVKWASEHSPEEGLDFWKREAGLVKRIELKANSQTVPYAQSGPIEVDLAGRKPLQIISYKDLPPEAASLGLNKNVGYFILDPANLGKAGGYKGLRDGEIVALGRDSPLRFDGLTDKFISRQHLTISRRGDDILIEDHSTHGTLVEFQAP